MTRTPLSMTMNTRRNAGGDTQESEATTPKAPKAPKVPTIPPMMHEPTSPSPMTRSRRGVSRPFQLPTTLHHGVRRDQQHHGRHTAENGVGVREEDEQEAKARRLRMVGSDTQRRLLVTIPLRTKRPSEAVDDSDAANFKHRRIAGNPARGLSKTQAGDRAAIADSANGQNTAEKSVARPDAMMNETTKMHGDSSRRSVQGENGDPLAKTGRPDHAAQPLSTAMEDIEAEEERLEDIGSDEEDESRIVPEYIKEEMQKFEQGFNGLDGKFKLLNKVGEGTFSSVYKAIDLEYDKYDNSDWDMHDTQPSKDDESNMEASPQSSICREKKTGSTEGGKVVAIKRIYVTSSPARIENEVAILRDLSGHKNVVALITAHRYKDQVILVLPYFEHSEFRQYYKDLPMEDIRCYLRALLKGLAHVHSKKIIHRDVKPSNFLYDTARKTGILVDFGLAERQEEHPEPTMPRNTEMLKDTTRRMMAPSFKHGPIGGASGASQDLRGSVAAIKANSSTQVLGARSIGPSTFQAPRQQISNGQPSVLPSQTSIMVKHERPKATHHPISMMTNRDPGYLRRDPRPVARVNRAGTRGFRAPEILFRHIRQTVALDIWSVGAILIAFLTGRFPFFHSYDEPEAVLEMAVLFGQEQMMRVAATFDRTFVTNISSINRKPISFTRLCQTLNSPRFGSPTPPPPRGTKSENRTRNDGMDDRPTETTPAGESVALVQIMREVENREDILEDDALAGDPEPTDKERAEGDKDTSTPMNGDEAKKDMDVENNTTGGRSSVNSTKKSTGWDSMEDLESAVSLLKGLLALNPEERITAEAALRHPFLMEKRL